MIYCSKCGKSLPSHSKYCTKCGSKIGGIGKSMSKAKLKLGWPSLDLNKYYDNIYSGFAGQSEMQQFVKDRHKDLKSVFQYHAIEYCFNKFVETELDKETPGVRGLGRLTTETPRFGGYYRDGLIKLSAEKIKELGILIRDVTAQGYTFWAIFTGKIVYPGKYSDGEKLFKSWIEVAYAGDPNEMGQELLEGLCVCVDPMRKKLHEFLYAIGITEMNDTMRDQITTWYALIGVALRSIEIK